MIRHASFGSRSCADSGLPDTTVATAIAANDTTNRAARRRTVATAAGAADELTMYSLETRWLRVTARLENRSCVITYTRPTRRIVGKWQGSEV